MLLVAVVVVVVVVVVPNLQFEVTIRKKKKKKSDNRDGTFFPSLTLDKSLSIDRSIFSTTLIEPKTQLLKSFVVCFSKQKTKEMMRLDGRRKTKKKRKQEKLKDKRRELTFLR